jgi:two-component system sensor histidine kinase KdpD
LLEQVRSTFGLRGLRITTVPGSDAGLIAAAGELAGPAFVVIPLNSSQSGVDGAQLEIFGGELSSDDRQLLDLLADQLAVAIDKQRLGEEAADAEKLADIDAVRTALLRAVSHDLRTPLASIKAMISGLRDPSVPWKPEQVAEAHATIEEEADRLNRLVGNLLDASRLQIGALAVDLAPTSIDVVLAAVARAVGAPEGAIEWRTVPADGVVIADPALLERSIDNVVRNALRHSPSGTVVTVDVGRVHDQFHIRVVDHGPGVLLADRPKVVQPFQRLDDFSSDGVGLGLSIAQGFVDAMSGSFSLDDTPGGGLTVTVALPAAPID